MESIARNVEEYKSEVVNLVKLMLPRLADGFARGVRFLVLVLKLKVQVRHSRYAQLQMKKCKN